MTAENPRPKARSGGEQLPPKAPAQPDLGAIHKEEVLKTLVKEQVLHALGEPQSLLAVQVRPLWNGRYRVNVLVGADVANATIPHSYFVAADGDGKVVSASPKILKLY